MKKLSLFVVLVMLSVVVSAAGNLLTNGNFSDDLNGWTTVFGGAGSKSAEVVYDSDLDSDVLEYKRWNSGNDGGTAGVYQDLSLDVDECSAIYLKADVKVISNTLSDSGWWSYLNGGEGEFPVHIWITYEDDDEVVWSWTHGFLGSTDSYNRANYDVVTLNQWYHYKSPNLVNVKTTLTGPANAPIDSPTPSVITRVALRGTGWDFNGRYDNVKLHCIKDNGIHRGNDKPDNHVDNGQHKSEGKEKIVH